MPSTPNDNPQPTSDTAFGTPAIAGAAAVEPPKRVAVPPPKIIRYPHLRGPRWLRISLRLRITLLTVLIFILIQSALSYGRYLYVAQQLETTSTYNLEEQATAIAAKLAEAAVPPTNESFESLISTETRSILVEELLCSLFTSEGKLIASNSVPEVNFALAGGTEANDTGKAVHRRFPVTALVGSDGQPRAGHTVAYPLEDASGRKLILIAATSDGFVLDLTRILRDNILLAIPLGFAASLGSGWFIAGFAVRPLDRLQQIAQMLSPDQLSERIDTGSTAIEVARLQERFNAARYRLDSAYRAQEQFAANIAHELKTPLAIMIAQADLVRADPSLPASLRPFVKTTREEALRLARLCDSLLVLTRVRHGKPIQNTARPYLVNEWMMDCVQDCRGIAAQFNADLRPTLLVDEDDIDAQVYGDRDLLAILLDNLVRNACRFSPPGGTVEIAATLVKLNGKPSVEIVVKDRGPGVPPGMLKKIFERFVQADESPTGRRGTGIGLPIAQGIAELHDGSITAANRADGGCAFTVRLPQYLGDGTTQAASPVPTPLNETKG